MKLFSFIITTLSLAFIISIGKAKAQTFVHPNEKLVYSFSTKQGNKMVLAMDTTGQYLVYRYGKANKINFSFPTTISTSWKKFTYSYYFRGGGIENAGLDLNYLAFTNRNFHYLIYDTYSAETEIHRIGITVTNLNTSKKVDYPGELKSVKGSLYDFRFNEKIRMSEELY